MGEKSKADVLAARAVKGLEKRARVSLARKRVVAAASQVEDAAKRLQRLMKVEVPEAVKVRNGSDRVTYTAVDAAGKESLHGGAACYASYMDRLPSHEFRLVIDEGSDNYLDGETYLEYVDILQQSGVIPAKVVARVAPDGKLEMTIPRENYSRHRVYITLCMYRFAESNAPLAYTLVKVWRERPEIPIWQAMHYAFAQHMSGGLIGHSWHYICQTNHAYVGNHHGGSYNLATSLAFPFVFAMDEEALHAKANLQTYTFIDEVACKICPAKGQQPGGYYYDCRPSLVVNGWADASPNGVKDPDGPNDVLNARWIPLYDYAMGKRKKKPEQVGKVLRQMYDEICKADPKLAAFRERVSNPPPPKKPNDIGHTRWAM